MNDRDDALTRLSAHLAARAADAEAEQAKHNDGQSLYYQGAKDAYFMASRMAAFLLSDAGGGGGT